MRIWTTACKRYSWVFSIGLWVLAQGAAPVFGNTTNDAMLMCNPPFGLQANQITHNSATLQWTSGQVPPLEDFCWTLTIGGQGLGDCHQSGQALQQFTICQGEPGVQINGATVSVVVDNLPPGTDLVFFVAETCPGVVPPSNVSTCAGPASFQTKDLQFELGSTVTKPSCPFVSPGYMANGAFTITLTDGASCMGTYSISAAPVAGSGPGGSTPPLTSTTAYIGFPAGNFFFGNAGAGQYTITVTETGTCNPATDPLVVQVVVPDGLDTAAPIWYLTDVLGNILADSDPLTTAGASLNVGTINLPEGQCGRQDEYYLYGTDNCDGFIVANNAISASATTTPASIIPGTQASVMPDGFGFYLLDVFWSTGTSNLTVSGKDAAGNTSNLTLSASIVDNTEPVVSILSNTQFIIPVCAPAITGIVSFQVEDLCDQDQYNFDNLIVNFGAATGLLNFTGNNYREYLVTFPDVGNYLISASYTDQFGNTGTVDQIITVTAAADDQPPLIQANAETVSLTACQTSATIVYSFTITDDCEPVNTALVQFNGGGSGLPNLNGTGFFFTDAVGPNTRYFEVQGTVTAGTFFPLITYQGVTANPTITVLQNTNQAADITLPGNLSFAIPQCATAVDGCFNITITDDCDNPLVPARASFSLGGVAIVPTFINAAAGYFEFCRSFTAADNGDLLVATYTDAQGAVRTIDGIMTVSSQPDLWAPIIVYPAQDIVISLDGCDPPIASFFFEAGATDNCDGNVTTQITASPSVGITIISVASAGATRYLVMAAPGNYQILVQAVDAAGNLRQEDFGIVVMQGVLPSTDLACNDTINVILNETCYTLVTPDMVLEGETGCLSDSDFAIQVIDGNPSNGALVDGCGIFSYEIKLADPVPINGFGGPFSPAQWAIATDGLGSAYFSSNGQSLTLSSGSAPVFGQGSFAGVSIVIPDAGQLSFDWMFDGADPGFDFFGYLLDAGGNPLLNFSTTQAGNATLNASVQAGYTLAIFISSPFDQWIASQAVISNFSFAPAAPAGAGDFTTCWGVIDAKDMTAPQLNCPADTDQATWERPVQRLNGALTSADPGIDLAIHTCFLDFINPSPGQHYYDTYTFTVSQPDVYTFDLVTAWGGGWAALFQGNFNPGNPCENVIAQANYAFNGSLIDFFPFDPVVRISLPLLPGTSYTIMTSASGVQGTALTGDYTWGIYSDGNGLVSGLNPSTALIARDLLCTDIENIAVDSLPLNIPRCYPLNNAGQVIWPTNLVERQKLERLIQTLSYTGYPGQPNGAWAHDNCGNLTICVSDQTTTGGNCGNTVITRTFVAADAKGNTSSCTQQINIRNPAAEDAIFPPYTAFLECDEGFQTNQNGNPHPLVTGYPFVQSAFAYHDLSQIYCNLSASYFDFPQVSVCPSTYKFAREWTLINWCSPAASSIYRQIIKVGDFSPPQLSCPLVENDWDGLSDSLIYSTGPFDCAAAFYAPLPEVTDNCSTWEILTEVVTEAGGVEVVLATVLPSATDRYVGGIPAGCHKLRYTATDACGNTSQIECPFCVIDLTAPIAICDDDLNVSIGGQGTTKIFAQDIDEGSWDNCDLASIKVRRLVKYDANCQAVTPYYSPWADFVNASCCEVGDTITIELQVTDMAGQVDICWLSTLVEDKIKPQCQAPHDATISCDELPYGFDPQDTIELQQLFGYASPLDNCPQAWVQELAPIVNLHECGYGVIIRRFRAYDKGGNISLDECQQIIAIQAANNYEIRFPADAEANCGEPAPDTIRLNELACDLLAVSVVDETFSASDDECYKIGRTYRVINWCEYDGQSPPVVLSRDEDCDGAPGDEAVWVMRRPNGGAFIDRDSLENNGLPAIATKPSTCDGNTNPAGYWRPVSSLGYWEYTQFIKIYDNTPPQILFSVPDPYCSFDPVGCDTEVEYVFLVFETCTPNDLSFQIFYDENADGELDLDLTDLDLLSGQYPKFKITWEVPIGMHAFEIIVEDGCGNTAGATMPFEVVDCKAPGPVCINGLAIDLMPNLPITDVDADGDLDEGAIPINVNDFIASPVTDCSMPVRYSIHRLGDTPSPEQTSIMLTCDDRPNLLVRIYAWDTFFNPYSVQPDGALGGPNYSYCETYVLVQDNVFNACGGEPIHEVSGFVRTEEGEPVVGIPLNLSGGTQEIENTLSDGSYRFSALQAGYDYSVAPQWDVDPLNGVSTYDVVLITKHILGVQPLDSPYKRIAADVNRSGLISTYDIIQLRRLILYLDTDFANNTSWRFVPKAYVFPNPSNPWEENFPEVLNFNDLSGSWFEQDFVAIKTGDVNASALLSYQSIEERAWVEVMPVTTPEVKLTESGLYEIWFEAPDLAGMEGFQFTLEWDPSVLQAVVPLEGQIKAEHMGQQWLEQGRVTVSWNKNGIAPLPGLPLMGLRFTSLRAALLSRYLWITSRFTPAEAYPISAKPGGVRLHFLENTTNQDQIGQLPMLYVWPNPFKHDLNLRFYQGQEGTVIIRVIDIYGRICYESEQNYIEGWHESRLDERSMVKSKSIFWVCLETAQSTIWRQVARQ